MSNSDNEYWTDSDHEHDFESKVHSKNTIQVKTVSDLRKSFVDSMEISY